MERELSSTLLRHIKRSRIDMASDTSIPMDVFREFIGRIDATYEDFKERENRYETICRQSSDEISNYISKLKQAEAINRQQQLDILNMLKNIRQGIFTITANRLIHPEYSVHTSELLEKSDLAGCDVGEVLLQKATLDPDVLQQILSALDFAIGSEDLAFEANQHILPRQLILNFPEGREKTLELDWTAIINDQEMVEKILVSIRDVSEIRLLEKVNLNQQRELEILSQLMSTNASRFQQFHKASVASIEHGQGLLNQQGLSISIQSLQELYRDLHTIKGNARMFGFRGITNLVHEAEDHYKVSVHKIHESWNTVDRLKDLDIIRKELDFYAMIADKAFGSSDASEQQQSQQFMAETLKTLQAYRQKECSPEKALQDIEDRIRSFEYAPLDKVLASVVQSAALLAQELGKLPPEVQIDQTPLGFHRNTHVALESVFNHLIRNAIDHGIEAEDERLRHGKAARGRIQIQFETRAEGVSILFQDDGRGLNLQRIQQKAQALGLLEAGRELQGEQLAQLIFEPGLSTRQEESQVSGRGMGMDAVRNLARGLGGDVRMEMEKNSKRGNAVRFVIELPTSQLARLNSEVRLARSA